MTAIVFVPEDGTGLADANTYLSADDIRTYASNRGIALPAVAGTIDPISGPMVLAMDYLDNLDYQGYALTATQALLWPRMQYDSWYTGFFYLNPIVNPTFALSVVQNAQAQLVVEQVVNNIQLFASKGGLNQSGGFLTTNRFDVFDKRYSEKIVPGGPDMPAVRAILRNVLATGNGLRTVRM